MADKDDWMRKCQRFNSGGKNVGCFCDSPDTCCHFAVSDLMELLEEEMPDVYAYYVKRSDRPKPLVLALKRVLGLKPVDIPRLPETNSPLRGRDAAPTCARGVWSLVNSGHLSPQRPALYVVVL